MRGADVRELAPPVGEGSGEPFLSSSGDGVYLSWLQNATDGAHELRVAPLDRDGWGEPRTVARGPDLFVNWADFPPWQPGSVLVAWTDASDAERPRVRVALVGEAR